MKKKLVTGALLCAFGAVAVTGGTLAYFTDEAETTNTFTTAKVNIALNEQQRDIQDGQPIPGSALEVFEQGKKLFPIVTSAQSDGKDSWGLPLSKNYVDKIITIANEADSSDAYVRVYIAVPEALDNATDAGKNVLHFNIGNKFDVNGGKDNPEAVVADHENWGVETLLTPGFNIDGINYNIYYRDYNKVLPANTATGSAAYVGFYLDKNVDYDNVGGYYTINGEKIDYDFTKGVKVPVYAVGVQATGFTGASEAVTAAFGANFNPFAE